MVYWACENNIDSPNIAELLSIMDLGLRILRGMLDALRSMLISHLLHRQLPCRHKESTKAKFRGETQLKNEFVKCKAENWSHLLVAYFHWNMRICF